MKTNFNRLLLIIIILLFGYSCSKKVDIDLPDDNPKLVVGSFFTKDSVFKVLVSHTLPITQNGYPIIDNAQVELYKNNQFIENLYYENNFYKSYSSATENERYQIKIKAKGYKKVSAESKIPVGNPVLLNKNFYLNYAFYTYDDGTVFPISKLECTIADDLTQLNYYEISIYIKYFDSYDQKYRIIGVAFRKNENQIINNENIIDYYPSSIVFSNELFTSNQQKIDMDFRSFVLDNIQYHQNSKLIIILRKISKEYYLYQKSYTLHRFFQSSDEIWGSPAPVKLYSNVQGGLGIFAGYSQVIDSIAIN